MSELIMISQLGRNGDKLTRIIGLEIPDGAFAQLQQHPAQIVFERDQAGKATHRDGEIWIDRYDEKGDLIDDPVAFSPHDGIFLLRAIWNFPAAAKRIRFLKAWRDE